MNANCTPSTAEPPQDFYNAWTTIDNDLLYKSIASVVAGAGFVTLAYSTITMLHTGEVFSLNTCLWLGGLVASPIGMVSSVRTGDRIKSTVASVLPKDSFPEMEPTIRSKVRQVNFIGLVAGAVLALGAVGINSVSSNHMKALFDLADLDVCLYGFGRSQSLSLDVRDKIYDANRPAPR